MSSIQHEYMSLSLYTYSIAYMGSAAGGQGGRPPPPDFGENVDFFDFCNDKSDFLSIPPPQPPPQILGSSGPHVTALPSPKQKLQSIYSNLFLMTI